MTADPLLLQTRRHFFGQCALGVGSMALASLLNEDTLRAAPSAAAIPGAVRMGTEELSVRAQEIPRDREIILFCS